MVQPVGVMLPSHIMCAAPEFFYGGEAAELAKLVVFSTE